MIISIFFYNVLINILITTGERDDNLCFLWVLCQLALFASHNANGWCSNRPSIFNKQDYV